jgi:hypothetical protein
LRENKKRGKIEFGAEKKRKPCYVCESNQLEIGFTLRTRLPCIRGALFEKLPKNM